MLEVEVIRPVVKPDLEIEKSYEENLGLDLMRCYRSYPALFQQNAVCFVDQLPLV